MIETSDTEDLERLTGFTNSLQPVCSVSESTERFYRVCLVLCNVARLYIDAKAKQQQESHDIHMYLGQLGFMPQPYDPPAHTAAEFSDGGMPAGDMDASQSLLLGNWFSGNRHILGLVEEDLSEFEPQMWSGLSGGA